MNQELVDVAVVEALQRCADEPAHIPGAIQPIGTLLASHRSTGVIRYASSNATDLFGCELDAIFGRHLRDLLGSEIWHAALNFLTMRDFSERRYFAGIWNQEEIDYSIHVSTGGEYLVVEVESASEMPSLSAEMLREQTYIVNQIQSCEDQQSLFDLTCKLLRHVSGFDRVMIYKFDAEWNGEIQSEARKHSMESFAGLRFPHWDIPEQARAIMARIQLRLISNINESSVPLCAQTEALPPLDISLAQSRAPSPIHAQYLRNMGVQATMTLSVVLDGVLWGMISFHHEEPMCLSPTLRHLFTTSVLPVFCLKLGLLREMDTLALTRRIDTLQADVQNELEHGSNIASLLKTVGPDVCDALDVDGLVITTGSQSYSLGQKPSQSGLDALIPLAFDSDDKTIAIESLATEFPDLRDEWGNLAGVFAVAKSNYRCLLLFRREVVQHVNWAGDPTKTIETVDGNARLQPRGSFKRYLEAVQGRCKSWTHKDRHMAGQLWPLLSSAERQAFMTDLSRQQTLMINELNHRVRNILALVKSVSQGARKKNGSLESYSQALESRIMALASAHEIGNGSAQIAVSIKQIIALESEPYEPNTRFKVTGKDFFIRADIAPIFALVVHELTTNAVKHGALSNTAGTITINIRRNSDGIELVWSEANGPETNKPASLGFGTTLILQAVPYELQGTSNIEFAKSGLQALITLPSSVLDRSSVVDFTANEESVPLTRQTFDKEIVSGLVLILEDNFMIVYDMVAELEQIGFRFIETCANAEHAYNFLKSSTPKIALLDVNLGQGKTSLDLATELLGRAVPIAFITGYGDKITMPPHLKNVPILTKPVSQEMLRNCISQLI